MNRNVRIARQLIALAKELVAEKPRNAYHMAAWQIVLNGMDYQNWHKVDTFDELIAECSDVDRTTCGNCILHDDGGDNQAAQYYFNAYKAPFFIHKSGSKTDAMMHIGSCQLKDVNTNMTITDENLLKSAAMVFMVNYGFDGNLAMDATKDDPAWEKAKHYCKNDFKAFVPLLEEAQEKAY